MFQKLKDMFTSMVTLSLGLSMFGLYALIAVATLGGIAHSFKSHSAVSGVAAMFFPPFAWYQSAESIWWHDDFSDVDWELRLSEDTKLLSMMLSASISVEPDKAIQLSDAIESMSRRVSKYPESKKEYLKETANIFIAYNDEYLKSVIMGFKNYFKSSASLEFKNSQELKIIENKLESRYGGKFLVAEIDLAMKALKEGVKVRLDSDDADKFSKDLEKVFELLQMKGDRDIQVMTSTKNKIFKN